MVRVLLILLVGLVIGYLYGWRDAQIHDEPAYARVLSGVGGAAREHVREGRDIDARMNALEQR